MTDIRDHQAIEGTSSASSMQLTPTELLEQLKEQVKNCNNESLFAIGGTIPIYRSDSHDGSSEHTPNSASFEFTAFLGNHPSHPESSSNAAVESTDEHQPHCSTVTVRWDSPTDGSGASVTLPCKEKEESQLEKLINDCEPASFGRGGKDVLDESYRKAGKLDQSAFSTNFDPYSVGVIDVIRNLLLPSVQGNYEHRCVRAELYKLNVYSAPSGKFKAHVDTPRSKFQFGSLVVCLPCQHEGGQLVVRHAGKEVLFDWSTLQGLEAIQWAAFYSDCEHEVFEVTKGHRLTLTYNLYVSYSENASHCDPRSLLLYPSIKALSEQPAFRTDGYSLGVYCSFAYPHTDLDFIQFLPMALKGVDKMVYECFKLAGLEVNIRPVMDASSSWESDVDFMFERGWLDRWGRVDEWDNKNPLEHVEGNKKGDAEKRAHLVNRFRAYFDKRPYYFVGGKLHQLKVTDEIYGECGDRWKSWDWWGDFWPVKWLNSRKHKLPALAHGVYGNQAEVEVKYSSIAIIASIPKSTDRHI